MGAGQKRMKMCQVEDGTLELGLGESTGVCHTASLTAFTSSFPSNPSSEPVTHWERT